MADSVGVRLAGLESDETMPVLAFDMTSANHDVRRLQFRGAHNTDFYEGDLRALLPQEVDMRLEKTAAGAYAIYKLNSRSGLAFRRSWSHIRSDKTDVTVFWFVRRGQINVACGDVRHSVMARECTITRSSRPFYMEAVPEKNAPLELMLVVVPSHELQASLGEGLQPGRPYPAGKGDFFLVERIFSLLFEEDEEIDGALAEPLIGTLLQGLGKSIARREGEAPARCSVAEKRLADVLGCINRHYTNPDLNARMVAEKCGISLRYLCHVLKKNELSFSHLVWERRVERAQTWLKDPAMQHHLVCEIAYLAGFKSSAHFSRMFKSRFGTPPRDYRERHLPGAAG